MKNSKTRIICEAAIFIAMAEILSLIKLYEFPNGGSINLGMLPIILFAARHGCGWGSLAGLVFGTLDYLIGSKFYEDDATAATQIFSNQKAIDQLMDGHIDEAKSAFELISIEGDSIRADWKTALCNQPSIKEEMARIESEGQVPTFVVSVSSIVANDGTYAEN